MNGDCGGNLTASSGVISHQTVSTGEHCIWSSLLPRLYLTFTEFDLRERDVLSIYDEPVHDQYHLIANYSRVTGIL